MIPKDGWILISSGGADSTVYHIPRSSCVAKVYDQDWFWNNSTLESRLDVLKQYRNDTLKASGMMRLPSKAEIDCNVHVVPQGCILSFDGQIISIGQRYIEGHDLYDASSMEKLRSAGYGIDEFIDKVKTRIFLKTGTSFHLTLGNIKVISGEKDLDVYITDLASSILSTYNPVFRMREQ